jgi:hypothetical protein
LAATHDGSKSLPAAQREKPVMEAWQSSREQVQKWSTDNLYAVQSIRLHDAWSSFRPHETISGHDTQGSNDRSVTGVQVVRDLQPFFAGTSKKQD